MLTQLEQKAAALSRKATRIEDELDLRNLQEIFGYYFDKRLWDDVVALFTDDGSFEVAGLGAYSGKASMRRFLDTYGEQPISRGCLNNHMQLQPIISVAEDGRTAKARWHLWAQLGKVSQSAQWGEGIYENEYVKEKGIWKMRKLHLFPNMYTDYQQGWGRQAFRITELLSGAPKPDLPETVPTGSYPQVSVPPFHYVNPVSGK
jgi:SnoaL-like protein